MNEPTPLSPEQIDELISAELDGEFDAAARDLGWEPAAARAALDAQPGTEQRRASMRAARGALSEIPAMDELVAARLRAKAIREAERGATPERAKNARTFAAMSAIAAAIAVVVGVAFVVNRASSPSARKTSNGGAVASPARTPQLSGALGAFADANSLVARARAASAPTKASPSANQPGGSTKPNSASGAPSGSGLACTATAQHWAGVATQPELASTATVAGAPVEVFVFRTATEQIVAVTTPAPGCALVAHDVTPASSP